MCVWCLQRTARVRNAAARSSAGRRALMVSGDGRVVGDEADDGEPGECDGDVCGGVGEVPGRCGRGE